MNRLSSALSTAPGATPAVKQSDQRHQRGHQHDIDELQAQSKRIDFRVELVLHFTQFLVDHQLPLAELLDLVPLFGGDGAGLATLGRLQFIEPASCIGQLLLQLLLFLQKLLISHGTQCLNACEWTLRGRASAYRQQRR